LNEWLVHIPPEVRSRAYQSGLEFAWQRDDAIRVVEVLKSRFLVIGVDIWLPTVPGPTIPTPFIYDWDLEREKRSPIGAAEFIRNFQWAEEDVDHQGLEPYFNLTVVPLNT
jgi:hypothetical protein